MRPLEIIDSIVLASYLLWPHPRPFAIRLLPPAALIVALIHLSVEGYRWQMVPLYVLNPVLTIISLLKISSPGDWPAAASFVTMILLALSSALPFLLPVPKFRAPGGMYKVGTTIYEFTDRSRKEIYSGKDEARHIMVQVWYPAKITGADVHAPWMVNARIFTRAIATYINFPPFFLDHLALIKMPSYKDAAISDENHKFPVLLFSHGWSGFNTQNTSQAIELASHGFVVISTQHTYGAVVTVFPDGTVAPGNPKTLPEDEQAPDYEVVARTLVDQWTGDLAFVLDQFENLNDEEDGQFFQKLDMERVGVYGHSTGSGAAIQFGATDPRCKAVLGMDPFMRPVSAAAIASGVTQPSFFMFSQLWSDAVQSRNNVLFNQLRSNSRGNKGVIRIAGTKHYDFSDVPLLSPIATQLGLKGRLNGRRVMQIISSYILDFFEVTLNEKPAKRLDGPHSDYAEVSELK